MRLFLGAPAVAAVWLACASDPAVGEVPSLELQGYLADAYDCHEYTFLDPGSANRAEFRCNSGKCISILGYCNGYYNCEDGSDESEGCKSPLAAKSTPQSSLPATTLLPSERTAELTKATADLSAEAEAASDDALLNMETVKMTTAEASSTTLTTTSMVWGSATTTSEGGCFEDGVAYMPFDMEGQPMSTVETAGACQARCASTAGCKHFSYYAMLGHCHISDTTSMRVGLHPGFSSGPAVCGLKERKCIEPATSYAPILLGKETDFSNVEDLREAIKSCQKLCASNYVCKHFVFTVSLKRCDIATDSASRMPNVLGTVSGPPSCQELEAVTTEQKFLSGPRGISSFGVGPVAIGAIVMAGAVCSLGVASRWLSRGGVMDPIRLVRQACVVRRSRNYQLLQAVDTPDCEEDAISEHLPCGLE